MAIIQDASGDLTFDRTLESPLLKDLQAAMPQGVNSKVALSVYSDDGALIAGLSGTTSYGWLRVNMIWVDQHHRRAGYARQLMRHAFDVALDRGCHSAWLETSSAGARDFYLSIGFEQFGQLCNGPDAIPPSHQRWFLKASLRP